VKLPLQVSEGVVAILRVNPIAPEEAIAIIGI
jgi:hypothetical protein